MHKEKNQMTACIKKRIEFIVNKSKVIGNLFIPGNEMASKYIFINTKELPSIFLKITYFSYLYEVNYYKNRIEQGATD